VKGEVIYDFIVTLADNPKNHKETYKLLKSLEEKLYEIQKVFKEAIVEATGICTECMKTAKELDEQGTELLQTSLEELKKIIKKL